MTTFVLVHGAWHQGSVWNWVEPLLREQGHRVFAPSLDHSAGTRLRDHVDQLNGVVSRVSDPVALVAHSYAGIPASEVLATVPGRIANFILIEGWLTKAGQSMLDATPDWFGDWCRTAATGDPAVLPVPPLWTFGLEQGSGLEEWLAPTLVEHPLSTFTDVVSGGIESIQTAVHGAARPALDAVICTPALMPFRELAEAAGFRTHAIESGHDVMLTKPGELAAILCRIVDGS